MNINFEYVTALQYDLKAANIELEKFRNGEKYIELKNLYIKESNNYNKNIKSLQNQLNASEREKQRILDQWFDVYDDVKKEHQKELDKVNKELIAERNRAIESEIKTYELKQELKEKAKIITELQELIKELEGKMQKLTAQLNRDFENSSIPSSKAVKPKKIPNSREKTDRKPGAQPGHEHHGRKKHTPTEPTIKLKPAQEILDDPDFKPTGKFITKQVVGLRIILDVKEYTAEIYRNSKTGERIHAKFPKGVVDDVNYDGSIKAFLYLLNNDCCVSIDKCSRFLSELTDDKLKISKGMINKLSKEFSEKTEEERKKIFASILNSPVVHIDCTNAKVNGKSCYVFVNATPDGQVLYTFSNKKGHAGVEGTPAELYTGILIHDHELTFYKYGSNHQECLAHVLRYLIGCMENEPNLTWHKLMIDLLREMLHARTLLNGLEFSDEVIADFERRYEEILEIAKKEYEDNPPSEYYKEGYNLYKRLSEYKSNHLLFLHDLQVEPTNNEAERLLRKYKRKQAQATTFRSEESLEALCNGLSLLVMMRKNEDVNVFAETARIFA